MQRAIIASILMCGFLLWLAGCNATEPARGTKTSAKTLYDRLGGKSAISAVVDDFIARVAADSRINGKFATANIPRLKTLLVDHICQLSGGPCRYSGRDMKNTHAGMSISSGDFDAWVGDLVAALTRFKVPEREKDELLGALGALKSDIVTKPMTTSMH